MFLLFQPWEQDCAGNRTPVAFLPLAVWCPASSQLKWTEGQVRGQVRALSWLTLRIVWFLHACFHMSIYSLHFYGSKKDLQLIVVVVVQSLSRVQLFVTLWTAAHQACLSFTISLSLLKLMSIQSVIPPNHLVLCHPLLLLPSIFPSIRIFSNESALLIRWPKYWSFSISPSNVYSGLISFRIDWFDLLAV